MPESTTNRDEAQRRMLVALADAAPLSRRRPRGVLALTVFAISGILAGAATSAAVALTAESRAGANVTVSRLQPRSSPRQCPVTLSCSATTSSSSAP